MQTDQAKPALHDNAATFQFAYDAWEIPFDSCFNLSVLLLLLMISTMMLLLLLLTRIAAALATAVATVVLLLLLPMVSNTVARPISTTILMSELRWHLRWATLKIDIYSACVTFCGILQSHLPADLLDAWLDLLDMIGRVISFSYNTIRPTPQKSMGQLAFHYFKPFFDCIFCIMINKLNH